MIKPLGADDPASITVYVWNISVPCTHLFGFEIWDFVLDCGSAALGMVSSESGVN